MLPLGSAVWSRGGGVPSSPSPRPPATPSSWSPPPRTACPGCSRRAGGARWRRFGCGGFGSPPPLASSRRAHTRWHATAATHTGRLRPGGLWWLQPSRPPPPPGPPPTQVPPSLLQAPPPPTKPPPPPTQPHRTQQPYRPQRCTNPPTPYKCNQCYDINCTNTKLSIHMETANVTILPPKAISPEQWCVRIPKKQDTDMKFN